MLLTFSGRMPYKSSGEREYPIEELEPLHRRWTSLTESEQGEADTSAGSTSRSGRAGSSERGVAAPSTEPAPDSDRQHAPSFLVARAGPCFAA